MGCEDDVKSVGQKITFIGTTGRLTCAQIAKQNFCYRKFLFNSKNAVKKLCPKSCASEERTSKISFIKTTKTWTCTLIGRNKNLCSKKLFSNRKKTVSTICEKSCGVCH